MTVTDIEILARGWMALRNLQDHADNRAGIPALHGGACRPCMDFVAALLRGADAADVIHLRCTQAQKWHCEVQAADPIARVYAEEN